MLEVLNKCPLLLGPPSRTDFLPSFPTPFSLPVPAGSQDTLWCVRCVGLPVPAPRGATLVPSPRKNQFLRIFKARGSEGSEDCPVRFWRKPSEGQHEPLGWVCWRRTKKHILGQVCLHRSPSFLFMYLFVCLFEWGGGWLLQSSYIVRLNHRGQQEVTRNGRGSIHSFTPSSF